MAEIKPFRGVHYAFDRIGNLDELAAPPYDVLSGEQVKQLHEKHARNITWLTRPASDDPYSEAARLFRQWIAEGVFEIEDEPSYYIYRQTFSDPETGRQVPPRLGLIAALKLEEYGTGKIIPHENTITAHRADRLNLIRQVEANLESIYGLYSDPDRSVVSYLNSIQNASTAAQSSSEIAGSTHEMLKVSDPEIIAQITQLMAGRPVFIADGHHRYETSLAYRREAAGNPEADYILITLTAFEDEGLLVLPTHRLLSNVDIELLSTLPTKLEGLGFDVSEIAFEKAVDTEPDSFGFVLLLGTKAYDVKPQAGVDIVSKIPGNKSKALKSLNVTILSALAFEEILGIPIESLSTTDKVGYTRDAKEAVEFVKSGTKQAAFLLNRPTVEQIQVVASHSEKMPQKSTYFFPKLLSGLIVRDLKVS
jgi:uncharacterized protein (DUF1015 family)